MPTSIKAALKKWEEATGKKAAEARYRCIIPLFKVIKTTKKFNLKSGLGFSTIRIIL
jgi:hypothetical protein